MNKAQKRVLLVLGVLALISAIWIVAPFEPAKEQIKKNPEPKFKKEGTLAILGQDNDTICALDIEIADDEYQRSRGMMFRKSMKPDRGMLFIFEEERLQSFWMHNTHISLDIIFIAADGTIVSAQKFARPYTDTSLPSEGPAQYVLEVNAGFWDKHGLQKGQKVVFERI